jgi:hypothetical protein
MRVQAASGTLPPVMARFEHVSLRDLEEPKQSRSWQSTHIRDCFGVMGVAMTRLQAEP